MASSRQLLASMQILFSPDTLDCISLTCQYNIRLWIQNAQSCWEERRAQTTAVLSSMLPEHSAFGSSTESLDPRQTSVRLTDADGWKVSDSCAEADRMPDYKSVQEAGLLSTLLSRSTLTFQCKLFNMKNNVHPLMTRNHRMSLEDVFL